MPIEFSLERCRWGDYDKEKMAQIFEDYEFQSLISRLPEKKNKQANKAPTFLKKTEGKTIKNNLSFW